MYPPKRGCRSRGVNRKHTQKKHTAHSEASIIAYRTLHQITAPSAKASNRSRYKPDATRGSALASKDSHNPPLVSPPLFRPLPFPPPSSPPQKTSPSKQSKPLHFSPTGNGHEGPCHNSCTQECRRSTPRRIYWILCSMGFD